MAALLKDKPCPVCNGRHDFFWAYGDLIPPDQSFTFTCPKEHVPGVVSFPNDMLVRTPPPGAVRIELKQ